MAVTTDQKIIQYEQEGVQLPDTEQPATAATQFYRGTIALLRSGYCVEATSPTSTDICLGLYNDVGVASNLAVQGPGFLSPTGADGQVNMRIRRGTFYLASSTGGDAITQANVGAACYVYNEITVALTSGSSTRPQAGIIRNIDAIYGVAVTLNGGVA
jgi:hypothetical protein